MRCNVNNVTNNVEKQILAISYLPSDKRRT